MTQSNYSNEKNKNFYLKYIIQENCEIKRFFPLYSITIAGKCACNNSACNAVGKHPRVPFTTNSYRSLKPTFKQQGFLTGYGIVVVDIDINEHINGMLSLIQIAKKYNGIPETVMVHTGGGGKHYYFRTKKKFKNKTNFLEGIDLRAENGFVVFPPSNHKSGNNYYFDADLHPENVEVAELPHWLEEFFDEEKKEILCENYNNNLNKKLSENFEPFYVSDLEWQAIKDALNEISSNCSRDFWRKIGMCLYNTARDDAFDVWDDWSKKSAHIKKKNKSIYNRNDNILQWNTQFNYGVVNLPLEILVIAKKELPEKDPLIKQIEEKFLLPISFSDNVIEYKENENNEKYFLEAIELSEGFVKEYFEYATSHSRYSIKKLHFLAAFSALAAVSQSSFLSPTRCSLSLFNIGFANTGRGKDDVLFFLKNILSRVDDNLLSNDKYTSLNGLLIDLYEFNSRMHVSDEVHTYFVPMLRALPSSPIFAIPGKLMELWSHRDHIDGVKSKSFKIPKIMQPKLSLFTLSSFAGMKLFKDQNAISSGFLNRFLVAIAKESPKVNHESFRENLPENMVKFLKKIFDYSKNEELQEDNNSKKIIFSTDNNSLEEHMPQRILKKILDWENAEVKNYYQNLVERIDEKREHLSKNQMHEEHDMYSRYAEQIIRIASLHALGRASYYISLNDLKIAEKMMFTLAFDMLEFLDVDLKDSQFSLHKKKILAFFKTKKRKSKAATLRDITQLLGSKTSIAQETLDELVNQNILTKKEIINKNSTISKTYVLNS